MWNTFSLSLVTSKLFATWPDSPILIKKNKYSCQFSAVKSSNVQNPAQVQHVESFGKSNIISQLFIDLISNKNVESFII